ncbi:hypothetical protein BDV93DRAFT_515904 [Ceratobasidium sp. AG-I]|nr:hypothetical protein BDV93DRAFT_515904 [Ceratobasidium sp. AG-I]
MLMGKLALSAQIRWLSTRRDVRLHLPNVVTGGCGSGAERGERRALVALEVGRTREGRHVGSAGGVPAGPPASVAYPAAKNRKTKTASSVVPTETGTVAVQFTQSATTTYAAAAATASSAPDDDEDCEDDEDELPECEDRNDDEYW